MSNYYALCFYRIDFVVIPSYIELPMSSIFAVIEIKRNTVCEMCRNTEFFLVRIFPHSDWIQKDTKYLSIFSPNAGKYVPEKTPYLNTFHEVIVSRNRLKWPFRSQTILEYFYWNEETIYCRETPPVKPKKIMKKEKFLDKWGYKIKLLYKESNNNSKSNSIEKKHHKQY